MSPATGAHVAERQIIVGIMGGAEKKGVWTPARQTYVVALMGGVELDFREARMPPGVTEVIVFAVMGGAEIVVPPGVHVDMNGFALMGGFGQTGYAPPPTDPNAPVLRIGGFALMGGVEVNIRYPGERPRDARAREKLDRQERKRLPAADFRPSRPGPPVPRAAVLPRVPATPCTPQTSAHSSPSSAC